MRRKRALVSLLSIVITIGLLFCCVSADNSDKKQNNNNRFNVVFVLDSSGSMKWTDPNGYRFEAISQFANLLATRGNYLGGFVYSTKIEQEINPSLVNSQQDKNSVTDSLEAIKASGDTNIGMALLTAVNALNEYGDPNLPSVIVLLSDGNTDLPTKDELNQSYEDKAEAIELAIKSDIPIYTICLNSNGTADTNEMKQISDATGGVFREVSGAEDLNDVFNTFYELIYGTTTITIVDDEFPDNGVIEKTFDIPGIGVEEVNIIIHGNTDSLDVYTPDGNLVDAYVTELHSFTMIKVTDVVPGTWKIVATGIPKDQIKINMVYNTNLSISLDVDNDNGIIDNSSPAHFSSRLSSGTTVATEASQYTGYEAELKIMNGYEEVIKRVPMTVSGDCFQADVDLDDGVYYFEASLSGNYITKESEKTGPYNVMTVVPAATPVPPNTAPKPVQDQIEHKVDNWPYVGAKPLNVDLSKLATDNEDSVLRYSIESSSFMEGSDYTVSGNELSLFNCSLKKGLFIVKATDSGGLSCEITINVLRNDIGEKTIIILGIILLLLIIALSTIIYIFLNKKFMGNCFIRYFDDATGDYRDEIMVHKNRGRLYLVPFNSPEANRIFDSKKCFFQATGKYDIKFITNKKVFAQGEMKNTIEVSGNGFEIDVRPSQNSTNGIKIRFESMLKPEIK
ncbi:vWA domain-containing protein [Butyrivibrio sp. AE2032]|uniref:vWA domain-containing protein n=1 Tax=Butyrivibrio sp. AE2032 TaxID=1458463 RepID=UPI001639DFA4|nr:vWA domain-containing protein [Butyrivibrio sp. AE2032]